MLISRKALVVLRKKKAVPRKAVPKRLNAQSKNVLNLAVTKTKNAWIVHVKKQKLNLAIKNK